ncbi:Stp1/IreP family PP2C-type Ser/Thr phosphatase [Haloglomus irregulare]|uniref:Stp1/IreP family PP2C-type Ser/Thr phosphatase n=1 Tax=Haloglomus irregulare TaxID=2234134 RepID=A0A554MU92_9EURY|nr:Stp1/IreP family PP2C-type Ser/Thr phosphatase [Haloglomus irregulare]TSD08696.1 Stp1/IreP family PP2C-type Ser/Thr phosphatase [Haloglomus irregulare]
MTPLTTCARTDVGQQRETNEDAALIRNLGEAHLLAVADGMGGHAAGDVASELAIETFADTVEAALERDRTAGESVLREAVAEANEAVLDRAAADGLEGMGTTLVAALVQGGRALFVNVGDSRGYHIDERGRLEQVTTDQSLVQELVEQGELTEAEARDHPQRNVVSQALGTDETIEPDLDSIAFGGTVLCCSDGLPEEVKDEALASVVDDAMSVEAAAETLINRANAAGGSDNIAVALGAR